MRKQLIPLKDWAARRYPVGTPHVQTLRRWCREERIHPKPVKTGREYFLEEDAQYVPGITPRRG